MDLPKQLWKLKIWLRFLDGRSIAVPSKYTEESGGPLKFDRLKFKMILSAWQEGQFFCFGSEWGLYQFEKDLLSEQDVLLAEKLCRDRPRTWWQPVKRQPIY
jgi:hypothetical protein